MSAIQNTNVKLTQVVFCLLGVGILVPWNAFISAKSYFDKRLCRDGDDGGDGGGDGGLESIFAAVFNLSSVLAMGFLVSAKLGRANEPAARCEGSSAERSWVELAPHGNTTHAQTSLVSGSGVTERFKLGVIIPLAVTLAVFMAQAVTALLVTVPERVFKGFVLLSLAVSGVCVSIGSAGIVATANRYTVPDIALNPYLLGQSLGGVVVSLGNFIAAWLEDPSDFCSAEGEMHEPLRSSDSRTCARSLKIDWSAFGYFLSGSFILFLCLVGYQYLHQNSESVCCRPEYESVQSDAIIVSVSKHTDGEDASPRWGLEMHETQQLSEDCQESDDRRERSSSDIAVTRMATLDSCEDDLVFDEHHPPVEVNLAVDPVTVWRVVKGPATCIFLTFFVTLSIFPGITSELASAHRCQTDSRIYNDLFTPFSFVLFNLGDFTGRLLGPCFGPYVPKSSALSKRLVVASLLRFVSFPLIFLSVRTGSSQGTRVQVPSDAYSVTVQFMFAVSNGLLVSSSFVLAPSLLPHDGMQERMSEILQFALSLGLLAGSFFSFYVLMFMP